MVRADRGPTTSTYIGKVALFCPPASSPRLSRIGGALDCKNCACVVVCDVVAVKVLVTLGRCGNVGR